MGGEKHGSKSGGGYVGGFLNLFDWNAKSRKKLFSGKSDLPEHSKQKKKSEGNLPVTQFHLKEEEDLAASFSMKGSSDYSCASSVTDEEGYRTRAPGVVARLMGLDSLPTQNFDEPFSTPFCYSQSLQDTQYHRRNLEFHHDHQISLSGPLRSKVDRPVQKAMEPKPQKMINRPIEKFQTEVLPPKSAKSIPITHHKLLSPIKSPGFIPPKNAAHIMEAAAKIIESGPQATNNAKRTLLRHSSVPFKVRDLKEKVETAKRTAEPSSSRGLAESNAAKVLKGQSLNKSWNGSAEPSFRVYSDSEDCSVTKNKGKSISLALQAKVNVQRRESLNPSGGRSQFAHKEQSEVMPNPPFKCQSSTEKSKSKKPSTHNASTVLRQNNQKQNCLIDKEKLPSKPSNTQGRKVQCGDPSLRRHKSASKGGGSSEVGSRKLKQEVADGKHTSCSSTKNVPRKKRYVDGNFHLDKNQGLDNMLVNEIEKAIQSSSAVDRHFTWDEDSKRKGMDVVSFTFTAPMARAMPGGEMSRQLAGKNCADHTGRKVLSDSDSTNSANPSSPGCNSIEADALSTLLEQKLRELTLGVESSRYRMGIAGNSTSIFQDLAPALKGVPAVSMYHDKESQYGMTTEKFGGKYSSSIYSTKSLGFVTKQKFQGMSEKDQCGTDDTETRKSLQCRHPSPVSVLEPSSLTESCNSSDSADSNSIDSSKLCSSIQGLEVHGTGSSKDFHVMETDAELSDSASSTYTRTVARRHETGSCMTQFVESTGWELEYVNEILFNVELMFKDFALGRAREIINPHLFYQLENRKEVTESQGDEPKLRRKVLFDCVGEVMDLRCRRYANAGCRTWTKGLATLRRKDWLAKEVYKEISSWEGMGDCMVDDLVDKDMSSHYGKWLDFEVEAFQLGVDIEGRILNSLVNEVVRDILLI
ncbi:uncharacterized protein LOC127812289 [Diospyros lotus]|uniref:uncharacterized protein LOC127812289 n=1 Tax=Diospyros lotus TaxID=55363 RepID=UPI002252A484|nr:uncharacterized protein LOC127812289 [Diospyros lotus]XP_052208653.1 uncharacterized protein LOC127812289 [Diospyros lotus]